MLVFLSFVCRIKDSPGDVETSRQPDTTGWQDGKTGRQDDGHEDAKA